MYNSDKNKYIIKRFNLRPHVVIEELPDFTSQTVSLTCLDLKFTSTVELKGYLEFKRTS